MEAAREHYEKNQVLYIAVCQTGRDLIVLDGMQLTHKPL